MIRLHVRTRPPLFPVVDLREAGYRSCSDSTGTPVSFLPCEGRRFEDNLMFNRLIPFCDCHNWACILSVTLLPLTYRCTSGKDLQ